MTMKRKFANIVLRARDELGYTQYEVAEAVSVTVRWYQRIETGVKMPGSITLIRLILFLHLDVEELREEAGLVIPVRSSRRELLHR